MKRLILASGLVVLVLLTYFISILSQSANNLDQTKYKIDIPTGSAANSVRQILEAKGILRRESSFAIAARLLGSARNIQAGEYEFSPSEPLISILFKLQTGKIVATSLRQVKVTFPEGTSIYKMGEILRANGVSDPDKFQDLVKEGITAELRQQYWDIFKYIPSESLEGYLYPDTYMFFVRDDVATIAEKMVSRFRQVVVPFWLQSKKETKLTLHEILTLASIIEKEAQKPAERPIIASVFYNRLKIGMPLAADPTVKYALERPSKKVFLDQLAVKSPYNTYKVKGLPPGPICNPGLDSIKAAVYPAKTNYLFFVAKSDGAHLFSKTWEEHQKARQRAQTGP